MKAVWIMLGACMACGGSSTVNLTVPPDAAPTEDASSDAGSSSLDSGVRYDAAGNDPLAACLTSGTCSGCCAVNGCVIGALVGVAACGPTGGVCVACTLAGQSCIAGACQ